MSGLSSREAPMSRKQNSRLEGGARLRGIHKKTEPGMPLITVLTVVYNRSQHLERAIESVVSQSYPNLEYIVVDGASTDGTLDIIKKYDHSIDYWISEPDHGMYYALNKGIGLAHGDMIGLVHSDDFFLSKAVVSKVAAQMQELDSDIYHGDALSIMEYETYCSLQYLNADHTRILKTHKGIVHPASFISSKVYRETGGYDTHYRSASDYELFIRCVKSGYTISHLNFPVCGISISGNDRISNNCYAHREAYSFHKAHDTGNHRQYMISYLECHLRRLVRKMINGARNWSRAKN